MLRLASNAKPPHQGRATERYVVTDFTTEELELLMAALDRYEDVCIDNSLSAAFPRKAEKREYWKLKAWAAGGLCLKLQAIIKERRSAA